MKEIINVFKAIEALDKKVGEFEKRHRDPKVKDLFWEVYKDMKFGSWDEFEEYINDQFQMMRIYSTKFKDLMSPTKEEFYDKVPEKRAAELLDKLDTKYKYQTIKTILEFYGEKHRSKLDKAEKLNRSNLNFWFNKKYNVEKWDKEITPFKYNIIEVEEILIKREVLKEKIILRDPGENLKGINGLE